MTTYFDKSLGSSKKLVLMERHEPEDIAEKHVPISDVKPTSDTFTAYGHGPANYRLLSRNRHAGLAFEAAAGASTTSFPPRFWMAPSFTLSF